MFKRKKEVDKELWPDIISFEMIETRSNVTKKYIQYLNSEYIRDPTMMRYVRKGYKIPKPKQLMVKDLINDLERSENIKQRIKEQLDKPLAVPTIFDPRGFTLSTQVSSLTTFAASFSSFPDRSSW